MLLKLKKSIPNSLKTCYISHRFFTNFYLNTVQHHNFLLNNQFSYNNNIIQGHAINTQLPRGQNTTVVVGGGVVGASSALYLCQNTDDNVILLEKLPEIAKETSNANGGIYGTEYNIIWVSKAITNHFWNSLIQRDYPFKFHLSALLEKHMFRWIFNMFLCILRDKENLDKIDNLAKLSEKEFNSFQKIVPKEYYDVTADGLLSLFHDQKEIEKKFDFYDRKKKKGFKVIEMDEETLKKKEPLLADSNEKIIKGKFWPVETNVETEKFVNSMVNYCQKKYKNRFRLLTETNADGFLLNVEKKDNEILGVTTQDGVVKLDRIVVASGLQSKDLLDALQVKCLLAPVKGYTLSVPVENLPKGVKTIVSDEKKRMSFAQIGKQIRIAAFAEFMGRNKTIYEKRKKQIRSNLAEKIGEFPDDNVQYWVGLRPVSPDDVPFIGRIKKFKNLYINAGHGSKGTTLALGSARLLMDIMNPTNEESLNVKDYEFERFY